MKIDCVRPLSCGGPRVSLIRLVRKLEGDNAELTSYRLGCGWASADIQIGAFAAGGSRWILQEAQGLMSRRNRSCLEET